VKNASKDWCEVLKPRILKGILMGERKNQTLKENKVKETYPNLLKSNGSDSKNH